MKSEHRHELETNELSAGLAKSIENFKPYTGQIVTGVVAVLLLYVGLAVWNAQSTEREQQAWEAFALATDTSDPEMKSLQRVASDEQYAGTQMTEWAYVGWADRQVLNAMQYYLYDREKTKDLLRNVAGIYQGFSNEASDPQVMNRARFGLARVYELQNKLDEARQQYLTVRGDLQPLAAERAEQLNSEDVQEACAWLATAELPKRDQTGGQGATGERPSFNADIRPNGALGVPAPAPSTDGISEENFNALLNDLEEGSEDDNRYGEQGAADDGDDTTVGTDEVKSPAESDATENDAAAE